MNQFRTKARAVDLLGKGQISDLPTAISELWKNGYDAYARNLEAIFYPYGYNGIKKPIFVIADDGIGMTKDELLNKWLVLGTDSKTRSIEDSKGDNTLWQEPRVKMWEKGIGRLSVAYLWSPMLMLTKKRNHPLQALLFDWRILENFNLFLDDVSVPIETIENTECFDQSFSVLKSSLLAMLDGTKNVWNDQEGLFKQIENDISNLEAPTFFYSEILDSFANADGGWTKFIVFNPDEQLSELSITEGSDYNRPGYTSKNSAEMTTTTLAGLFNVFKGGIPPARTSFIIKWNHGDRDIVGSSDFFEPSDFSLCDHLIDGRFDDFGNFSGKIRIYKEEIPFSLKNSNPTALKSYWSFAIKVWYVAGEGSSSMEQSSFKLMNEKLKRFGGLYIYRDDYRVLPYWRTEFDFLNFEKRRSFGAWVYFFSHRRMFGCIEISREHNQGLKDKAGREGFINNRAYREFQADLENLFIALAYEYFATHAKSDIKDRQQEELEKERAMLSMEESRNKEERKNFNKILKDSPDLLAKLSSELSDLSKELKQNTLKTEIALQEVQWILTRMWDLGNEIKALVIRKPARFSISEAQSKKLFDFNLELQAFQDEELMEVQKLMDEARIRLKNAELLKEYEDRWEYFKNLVSALFDGYRNEIRKSSSWIIWLLDMEQSRSVLEIRELIASHRPSSDSVVWTGKRIEELEFGFWKLRSQIDERVSPVISFLNTLSFDINDNELVWFYKQRFEEIEKQWNQTKEMAQLWIVVEIIDHQFYALYSQLAYGIKNIAGHIGKDATSAKVLQDIETTFAHLEGQYKLMSPLYRSTRKARKLIRWAEIHDYVRNFFWIQLSDGWITLEASDSFNDLQLNTFESILFPVFVNVVNNAIYWLSRANKRIIRFDHLDWKILIMNSWERIEDFYLDKIFGLFYSRRQDGRWIGLYLAKENLSEIEFEISATNDVRYNLLEGACFVIQYPNWI